MEHTQVPELLSYSPLLPTTRFISFPGTVKLYQVLGLSEELNTRLTNLLQKFLCSERVPRQGVHILVMVRPKSRYLCGRLDELRLPEMMMNPRRGFGNYGS